MNLSVSRLLSGDIHELVRVRKPQASVTKYMRNRVPLTPSQTIRITARLTRTTRKWSKKKKNNKIQHIIQPNWWAMQNKPKWEKVEKNMNQSKQENRLKLTCSYSLPILAFFQLHSQDPHFSLLFFSLCGRRCYLPGQAITSLCCSSHQQHGFSPIVSMAGRPSRLATHPIWLSPAAKGPPPPPLS